MPEIHGHRGARALRPENTLPGLAHALAIGVDALEFDVTRSGDGGLILAHDLTADAVTIADTGPASAADPHYPYVGKRWLDLTLAQVATLDAGERRPPAPFGATFVPVPATGVPSLGQVCRLVAEARADMVTLSVELKTEPSWPDADVRALTQDTLAVLAAHDMTGRARILGFDWRVLVAAQAADPTVPRVALVEPRTWVPGSAWLAGLDARDYAARPDADDASLAVLAASGASAAALTSLALRAEQAAGCAAAARDIGAAWLSPWDPMISADLVTATHDAGLGVIAWTVNDQDRMAGLIEFGADAIVSDRPDLLRLLLAERGEPVPAACPLPWPAGVPDWAPHPAHE